MKISQGLEIRLEEVTAENLVALEKASFRIAEIIATPKEIGKKAEFSLLIKLLSFTKIEDIKEWLDELEKIMRGEKV